MLIKETTDVQEMNILLSDGYKLKEAKDKNGQINYILVLEDNLTDNNKNLLNG